MTSGKRPAIALALRTAMPGRVNFVGAAGGSAVRLPAYVTGCASAAAMAGYQSSTPSGRLRFGATPLAGSIARTSNAPSSTSATVRYPTPYSPSPATSGASTDGRLGAPSTKAQVARLSPRVSPVRCRMCVSMASRADHATAQEFIEKLLQERADPRHGRNRTPQIDKLRAV